MDMRGNQKDQSGKASVLKWAAKAVRCCGAVTNQRQRTRPVATLPPGTGPYLALTFVVLLIIIAPPL